MMWLLGTVLMGTLMALPLDADAQRRAAGARGAAAPARTPHSAVHVRPAGVHRPLAGAHSHRVYRGSRVVIGAPLIASPWWYGPYPYAYPHYYGYGPYDYPPVPYVYEQPMVYLERTPPPAAAPAPEPYWYYCQDSKTYYPHVQTCATPWQRVIPHAPQ